MSEFELVWLDPIELDWPLEGGEDDTSDDFDEERFYETEGYEEGGDLDEF
jgi:hypothetical protein